MLLPFDTANEIVTFNLSSLISPFNATRLQLWETHWAYESGDQSYEFSRRSPVEIVNGLVTINVTVNSIYTLTTSQSRGKKGQPSKPVPRPKLFPQAHVDNFESCSLSSEAKYFSDQNGCWECVKSDDASHGVVMQQKVPMKPITWGKDIRPHSLIGHRDAKDQSLVVDASVTQPSTSVLVGVRMQGTDNSVGILWGVVAAPTNRFGLWASIESIDSAPILEGPNPVSINVGEWHTYRMDINGSVLNLWIDHVAVLSNYTVKGMTQSGHGLIGTLKYGEYTQFDNFQLYSSYQTCGGTPLVAGAAVSVVECSSEVGVVNGSQWRFDAVPNSKQAKTISLISSPSLCLGAVKGAEKDPWWLQLVECDPSSDLQQWAWTFDGIAPDTERMSYIFLPAYQRCIDITNTVPEIGARMNAWPCNMARNQAFWADYDAGEIGNEATATCLGVC